MECNSPVPAPALLRRPSLDAAATLLSVRRRVTSLRRGQKSFECDESANASSVQGWLSGTQRQGHPSLMPLSFKGLARSSSSCASATRNWAAGRVPVVSASGIRATSTKQSQQKALKTRLDLLCLEQYPDIQPHILRSWIAQGKVLVGNKVVDKAGAQVPVSAAIQLLAAQERFVCRAGKKLEAAIQHFAIDVRGRRALDCGISTGGFTDCLLQHGAASVIGVDVGYGQVAERVRQDSRVTILERTNIRHLQLAQLPGSIPVDLVTLDLSFISILKVLQPINDLMTSDAELITLIKPQFEAEKQQVEDGGIVSNPQIHVQVIEKVKLGSQELGFSCSGVIESPIKGAASGNTEFLAYFKRS